MQNKSPAPVRRVVRKRLADGSVKTYVYDKPPVPRARRPVFAADSLRSLLIAYERSPEWSGLRPLTKKNRLIAMQPLYEIGHLIVRDIRRRDILTLRDSIATARGPAAANAFVAAMSVLLSWARDRDWIEHNPADRLKTLPGGHWPTWTEEQLAAALKAAPEPVRRVLVLAVHTGQRRGDLIAMRWSDVRRGSIHVKQEKTGKELILPIHPDLAAELEVWRRDATTLTLLADPKGKPWGRDQVGMAVMYALGKVGLKGISLHGVRKLAAVRLAHAGCTPHEVAAITGHASLQQVALYTAAADQERLATAAVHRLKTKPPGNREN